MVEEAGQILEAHTLASLVPSGEFFFQFNLRYQAQAFVKWSI
jgi:hypothetical protein